MPCIDPQSKYAGLAVGVIAVVLVKRVLDTDRYDGAVYVLLILMALLVVMIDQGSGQYGVREDTGWFFSSDETSMQSVRPAVDSTIVTERADNRTTIEVEMCTTFTASEGRSELWFRTLVVCWAEDDDCQVLSTEDASLESGSTNQSWFCGTYYDRLTYPPMNVFSSSQSFIVNATRTAEYRFELDWKIVLLFAHAEYYDVRYYANVSFAMQYPDILEPKVQSAAFYAAVFLIATTATLVTAFTFWSASQGMTAKRIVRGLKRESHDLILTPTLRQTV